MRRTVDCLTLSIGERPDREEADIPFRRQVLQSLAHLEMISLLHPGRPLLCRKDESDEIIRLLRL